MSSNYLVHATREQTANKTLVFDYGLCATDIKNPESKPINYHKGLEQVIQRGIRDGTIQITDKFDDRKYRMNEPVIDESNQRILVPLGLTYWKAYKDDLDRQDKEIERLRRLGRQYHNDEFAFFARALGIEVLPIFQDGYTAIGARVNETLKGKLNGVGGFVTYRGDPRRLDLSEDMYRELNEELGFHERDLSGSPQLVGIVSDFRGDNGILFLQRVNYEHDYIKSSQWAKRAKTKEHGEFVLFNDVEKVTALLRLNQHNLLFTTKQLLRSLRPEDLKAA